MEFSPILKNADFGDEAEPRKNRPSDRYGVDLMDNYKYAQKVSTGYIGAHRRP